MMIRHAFAAFLFLSIFSTATSAQQAAPQPPAAPQQTQTYTFTMTTEETNLMFNQLGKLNWVEVNPFIQKLIAQLREQNQAPAAPAAPPK